MKILIVDDQSINRRLMGLMVETVGHEAIEVESGNEALAFLRRETVDLILMDIEMPEMNGIETTRHIRAEKLIPQNRVIVAVTANSAEEDKALYREVGMQEYVQKPLAIDSLHGVIAKLQNDK